jgi:putative transcriptional regulator
LPAARNYIRESDGRLVEVREDGLEYVRDSPALPPMTEAEILAAAESDPDNPPLSEDQLSRMRPGPPCLRLRWRLGLSREDFARRFHLPVALVTEWENGGAEPDAAAAAFLRVIDREPEIVAKALETERP